MTLDELIADLVTANHILAHEGVLDAFGHVSIRHPDDPALFLLSQSRSPELVSRDDIMTFTHDGGVVGEDDRKPYLERFIHGSIYAERPDVFAVVHSHAREILPFAVTREPLRPVTHLGAIVGAEVPVWDIRDAFGPATNMLVSNGDQGDNLARALGERDGILMRGHGSVVVGRDVREATLKAIYLGVNAQVLAEARRIGEPVFLSEEEQRLSKDVNLAQNPMTRAWQYYADRAGRA
ncbi:MAG: class II aldolase/adducin family protein [Pseudomonadota bacterium]|nr:class II aldolase/adducin family protein [Pseudomonadota bacterium]